MRSTRRSRAYPEQGVREGRITIRCAPPAGLAHIQHRTFTRAASPSDALLPQVSRIFSTGRSPGPHYHPMGSTGSSRAYSPQDVHEGRITIRCAPPAGQVSRISITGRREDRITIRYAPPAGLAHIQHRTFTRAPSPPDALHPQVSRISSTGRSRGPHHHPTPSTRRSRAYSAQDVHQGPITTRRPPPAGLAHIQHRTFTGAPSPPHALHPQVSRIFSTGRSPGPHHHPTPSTRRSRACPEQGVREGRITTRCARLAGLSRAYPERGVATAVAPGLL